VRKQLAVFLSALLAVVCCDLAVAQEQPQEMPNVIIIYYFKVTPGMEQQFEAAARAHLEWLVEAECKWPWNTWRVLTGKRYGEYVVTSAFHTWADFDAYEEFFSKQMMHFRLTAGPLIESVECKIDVADFTTAKFPNPMDFDYINIIGLYEYHVRLDKIPDFEETKTKIHQAIVQADLPIYYYWEMLHSGGKIPCYYLIEFGKSWVDIGGEDANVWQAVFDAYGEEEAEAIFNKFFGSVKSIEVSTAKYLPHLSFNAGKIGWRRQ
jgi:hypothetical protein